MFHLYEYKNQQSAKLNLLYGAPHSRLYLLPANNKEYYTTHGLFESSLIKWCEQFGDADATKTMLDIGAHTGTYAISLAHKFGTIACFEPQKATYYALCGSVAMSGLCGKITCYQVGLGAPEQVGDQILYVPSVDGGGSSLICDNAQTQYLSREVVHVKTLDEYGFTNVGFIKMDIEGNELNCLRGAIKTIAASHPKILFESNNIDDLNAVTAFLKTIDYKVVAIGGYYNMFIAEHFVW